MPPLLVAEQQQQQPRETEGDRDMDVDVALAEGEENRAEAETGALSGKHHPCCKTLNVKVSIKTPVQGPEKFQENWKI